LDRQLEKWSILWACNCSRQCGFDGVKGSSVPKVFFRNLFAYFFLRPSMCYYCLFKAFDQVPSLVASDNRPLSWDWNWLAMEAPAGDWLENITEKRFTSFTFITPLIGLSYKLVPAQLGECDSGLLSAYTIRYLTFHCMYGSCTCLISSHLTQRALII